MILLNFDNNSLSNNSGDAPRHFVQTEWQKIRLCLVGVIGVDNISKNLAEDQLLT